MNDNETGEKIVYIGKMNTSEDNLWNAGLLDTDTSNIIRDERFDDVSNAIISISNILEKFNSDLALKDNIIKDKDETITSINASNKELNADLITSKLTTRKLESDIDILKHEINTLSLEHSNTIDDYNTIKTQLNIEQSTNASYKMAILLAICVIVVQLVAIVCLIIG